MFFREFLILTGFEPMHRKKTEKFKADLRKMISNLLFYIENNSQTLKDRFV